MDVCSSCLGKADLAFFIKLAHPFEEPRIQAACHAGIAPEYSSLAQWLADGLQKMGEGRPDRTGRLNSLSGRDATATGHFVSSAV